MGRAKNSSDFSIFYLIASILTWILTVGWMLLIFYLSSENGSDSTMRSSEFVVYINQNFGIEITEMIVRKTTHIIEFTVLTLLTFLSIRFTNMISPHTAYSESPVKMIKSDNELYIALTLWFTVLFSVLDEYHQLFVTGRSGSILDVCIDLIGIVVMLLIIRLVFTLYLIKLGKSEVRYD